MRSVPLIDLSFTISTLAPFPPSLAPYLTLPHTPPLPPSLPPASQFDRLSDEFITVGLNTKELLADGIDIIVMKAQTEHHLGFLYADLCLKLSNTPIENLDEGSGKGKVFKKMLLERCQKEFEQVGVGVFAHLSILMGFQ